MSGTVIQEFLAFLKLQKILGNFCFSKQIFYRKESLGAPEVTKLIQVTLLCMVSIFFFQACYVICRLTASISFFYDFLLNIRLNNKASSSHDCLHSMLSIVYVTKLLFSLYLFLRLHPSLLASHCSQVNCTGASLNKIVEFKRSLVYCAVQFSFHVHDLP